MDRRDFIKKSAIAVAGVAAGAVMASPITSAVLDNKNNKSNKTLKDMKVLLINGSPRPDFDNEAPYAKFGSISCLMAFCCGVV